MKPWTLTWAQAEALRHEYAATHGDTPTITATRRALLEQAAAGMDGKHRPPRQPSVRRQRVIELRAARDRIDARLIALGARPGPSTRTA
ncbi:hypothetical protein DNL40_02620 [Xylanimonas oleitrophica]|uniref:Uncharacterized protein n=1 Tax=Xylanimonas oleitrophica TaxID=2607479 RepID=A0A2W5WX82_9MICO|nr:hypothetical protein [Xylanimonas oleitrophica]PZR55283.1 hypothetical protein DNL40_02620 [Xylanimonas oleitrophica]